MISFGPFVLAQLDGGGNHLRVRVDHLVAMILHEIGLQDDPFARQRDLTAKGNELPTQHNRQIAVVVGKLVQYGPSLGLAAGATGQQLR